MKSNTETQQNEQTKNHISTSYSLVLYNDDVNTFDHVINCLIRICKHDVLQAEQCAWLVHNKGKCNVKSGKLSDLRKMHSSLVNNGLSAEIE
ncbi:ATP-dependent Clp protease adaptor ClpS [Crocinitomicaceae bacterium]|jgi:ATP-dependent Clp protease adaptor protein ClpS|nr:ATP-dependent Clp protease adaptor ClpS [Crocinitomicaceae bacterium]MDB4682725.1 ATP-dependent Clp protease adaptor ClpS [Crocinitomicaceae bacterium]